MYCHLDSSQTRSTTNMQNTHMREDKVIDEMSLYEYSPSRKDSTIHNAIFIWRLC